MFLRKVWLWIVAVVTAFFNLPLISDIVEFLGRQSVLALIVGCAAYVYVPQIEIRWLSAEVQAKLPDLIFWSTLLLVGRFSIEGILETRAGLPTSMTQYLERLIDEILKAFAERPQPPNKPPYVPWMPGAESKRTAAEPQQGATAANPITPWTALQTEEAPG